MEFDNPNGIYDEDVKNGIMLEPRLQEYMRKKEYCKQNKMQGVITPEEEYSITQRDLKKIKMFSLGNKDMYNQDNMDKFIDEDEGPIYDDPEKHFFMSHELKNDPRLMKLREKLERDREMVKQRHNYSNFNFHSPMLDLGATREKPKLVPKDSFDQPKFLDCGDYAYTYLNQNRDDHYHEIRPQDNACNITHVTPKINYETQLHYRNLNEKPGRGSFYKPCPPGDKNINVKCDNSLNEIIGELDAYDQQVDTTYVNYEKQPNIDYETKTVIPSVNCRDNRYTNTSFSKKTAPMPGAMTSQYKPVPLTRGGNKYNIENDNLIKCGLPNKDSKKKSYGYNNPAEHYFNYISTDIQDPNHVVMPFPRGGVSTRLDNTTRARQYYVREIM